MTLAHLYLPVTDGAGNLIPNISVTFRKETAGQPLGAPKADTAGATGLGNPATFADGVVDCYLVGSLGGYRLDVAATGYSKTFRHVSCGTGAQVDADTLLGAAFNYEFEAGTAAPPSAGCIRANHATWASATEVYISEANAAGSDIAAQLAVLAAGDRIIVTSPDGAQAAAIISSNTDSGAYRTLAVSSPTGDNPAVGSVGFQFGEKGQDGTMASVVAGDGIDVDATDPANPVVSAEAATTSNPGVAEIATGEEYRAGTDTGRVLGVAEAWGAAGFVTIADGATLTFDMSQWLSLIQTTLAGNRTVGDPSNVKPGQHFMWKLTASGSTRTFTLHADFKVAAGVESFPLSITTSETVYVYGFAESTNVIRVTAVQRFT